MCFGTLSTGLQTHEWVSGGSAFLKQHVYDPVNVWSTASCSAVEVVRLVYLGFLLWPTTFLVRLVASFHSGWWLMEEGSEMACW